MIYLNKLLSVGLLKITGLSLTACMVLTGCAATNIIHQSRASIYKADLVNVGEMRMVEAVSLDKDKKEIYVCLLGDFQDALTLLDQKYTLHITKAMMTDNSNKVSYRELIKGCNFTERPELLNLKLDSITESNEFEYPKYHTLDRDDEIPYIEGYVSEVKYSLEKIQSFPKLEIKVSNGGTMHNQTDRLHIYALKGNKVLEYTGSLTIGSIASDREPYTPHSYEWIGNIIDVVTGIIQVPLCAITLLKACSGDPHPKL